MKIIGLDVSFLQSVRFWKLVAIGVLEALVAVGAIDGALGETIARTIELVLGGSVVIGTVDKFGKSLGGKK